MTKNMTTAFQPNPKGLFASSKNLKVLKYYFYTLCDFAKQIKTKVVRGLRASNPVVNPAVWTMFYNLDSTRIET